MISIMGLFELRSFSKRETDENRKSIDSAAENMYQKSRVTDNMILRNSPLNAKGIKLLKRSIALKTGSTKLVKRMSDIHSNDFGQKVRNKIKARRVKQSMAA